MEIHASFMELWLADGRLYVRLGSGLLAEVLDLGPPRPRLVFFLREPTDSVGELRVRLGVAELGPDGLEPKIGDVYEQRGACGALFGQVFGTAKRLGALRPAVDLGSRESALLQLTDGEFLEVDPERPLQPDCLLIQVRMNQLQFEEALGLLSQLPEDS